MTSVAKLLPHKSHECLKNRLSSRAGRLRGYVAGWSPVPAQIPDPCALSRVCGQLINLLMTSCYCTVFAFLSSTTGNETASLTRLLRISSCWSFRDYLNIIFHMSSFMRKGTMFMCLISWPKQNTQEEHAAGQNKCFDGQFAGDKEWTAHASVTSHHQNNTNTHFSPYICSLTCKELN